MNAHIDALNRRIDDGQKVKFKYFWGHTGTGPGPWALSQWYPAPFTFEGMTYRTAEHWMMAQKALLFDDAASAAAILAADSPGKAKALGRAVKDFDDETWEAARYAIVVTGNVLKFRQNPELGAWLDTTGDVVLVEASPRDAIWGIGLGADDPAAHSPKTWRGQNLLGFALGEARARLRQFPAPRMPVGALPPPWVRFPEEHRYSAFWRMGAGEDYMRALSESWSALTPAQRVEIELVHPATGGWSGWY
ncbi:MAG: NADAR family protein [Sandaracinaceae bacterium]|nr:NADAR family protein [Sandaracinaceae bacterium]